MECGCFVSHRSAGMEDPDIIAYCPLHTAAGEMLEALIALENHLSWLASAIRGEQLHMWNSNATCNTIQGARELLHEINPNLFANMPTISNNRSK